ncbi:reverse transcriptase domain-containing protein [Tanacetum coccineum]
MADNRTMAQMLKAPIEGYEDAIVVPPINANNFELKQPLINLVQSNKFTDGEAEIAASLEDKITIKMKQMMNEMKALVVTTLAPVKAVEEVCVTCGSNHNFNHCPLTRGGNDFPVFHDNIQQFQQTAAVDGICKDVLVPLGSYVTGDFVVSIYAPDEQIPLILGRPFLRTARALIDVYDEKLILRDMYSGNPTIQSDDSFPSSSPMKTKDTFRIISNPLFEFDDSFKSSNVNPLFEENNKDAEIKSDSIPPGIDLTLPPTFEVSSSNPTSPTLTGEKICSWKMPMFFSLVRFVWKMMTQITIRKKIIVLGNLLT